MLKRLIPVLLVPVVLSSNFAAINVSADEETVIEANSQNETIENETNGNIYAILNFDYVKTFIDKVKEEEVK